MKFTLDWLKDHLDTSADLKTITDTLTNIGLEIENVEDKSDDFKDFSVAKVIKAEKHPDADKLKVCQVETKSGKFQVVCGAPNARAGIKGVFAPPGAIIPSSGDILKKGVIRGEESNGMLCSEREMGISDEHEGIIELDPNAEVGAGYATLAGLDDPVIDIAITPDRADCLGVRGIARDLAAAGLGTLKPLDTSPVKGTFKSSINWQVNLPDEEPALAPYIVGRFFRGVKNVPSPKWLQDRLTAIGLRPISALVDITNYIMLDLGRPLHAYDADKINGDIFIRLAETGEKYLALDGKEYTFSEDMIVIGDNNGVDDLAGIMGGERSGCDDQTVNMFLEAAIFDPVRTASTGRKLNIISDARYRFERGLDPTSPGWGSEMATKMILEICGGEASELVVHGREPPWQRTYMLRHSRIKALTGVEVPEEKTLDILKDLGFKVSGEGEKINCEVPPWRGDVIGEADLVEEVVRIWGFDNIPMVSMQNDTIIPRPSLNPSQIIEGKAKRTLANRDMAEAVTYSFLSSQHAILFGGDKDELKLMNPISSDLDEMRPSIIPNLISSALKNSNMGNPDVAIFEVGPQYTGASAEGQQVVAAGIRTGQTAERHWSNVSRSVDVFDVKGDVIALLEVLGAPVANLQTSVDAPDWYHPGKSGVLRLGPNTLAYFGEIHPTVLRTMSVDYPIMAFEVFLNNLHSPRSKGPNRALLKLEPLQPVKRDFAFILDKEIPAEKLLRAVRGADKNLIRDVILFDSYEGKGVPENKKSLAIAVTLQPKGSSLTEEELEVLSNKIVGQVGKQVAGQLRT